jgi:flagellar biosynthesis anti-sigma factor FlgM
MKIENDKTTSLLDSLTRTSQSKPQKDQAAEKKSTESTLDKVELSTRKEQIETIKEKVKAEPAVRQDKVDAAREAIKNETYNIKGELVARSILKSQLLDELL